MLKRFKSIRQKRLKDEKSPHGPIANKIRALSKLMHLLAQEQLDDFLPAILDTLADPQIFGIRDAGIFLIDREKNTLVLEASKGYSKTPPGTDIPLDRGIFGRAIRTEQSQYISNVLKDPDYYSGENQKGSEVVLPLIIREDGERRLIGIVDVERETVDAFSELDLAMLELFVEQVATYYGLLAALHSDHLTDALSPATLTPMLQILVKDYRRNRRPSTVVFCDINNLRAMNGTYGHEVGNAALRHFVHIARETIRENDQIIRFGGDEFILLLHDTDNASVIDRIVDRLSDPIPRNNYLADTEEALYTNASFGVVPLSKFFKRHPQLMEEDFASCLAVLRTEASKTMYLAKVASKKSKASGICKIATIDELDLAYAQTA